MFEQADRFDTGAIKVITAKSQNLLRTIVENYIAEGQPVASARLAATGVSMSPASIRFMMAELEEQGYLKSPHTSAGRIPTEQAYRFLSIRSSKLSHLVLTTFFGYRFHWIPI